MERLTERTADGILVKENHIENGLRTFYQLFEEKPNDKYTNCDGGYCAIEKLAAYEDAEEQGQYGKWIPVSERLPEDGTYITTLDGELVGQEEPFTGLCGIEDGKWDEDECVIAWMPLPEPYRESEVEDGKVRKKMAKCKNCKHLHTMYDRRDESFKWCAYINDNPHEDIERDCDDYIPMTNADRIRSMTDEELAMAIMCPAEFTGSDKVCDFSHDCKDCTLSWLQKESEE